MTDEQLEKILNEMEELFGELPNPQHEPLRFGYYVRMYQHSKSRQFPSTQ